MLKIGITGGIGSGKTTVCSLFQYFGIPVYSADIEAKRLMISHEGLRSDLQALFGNDIYFQDGDLDRKRLAKIIFNDKSSLAKVNAIVHPRVHQDFENWTTKQQNAPFVLKEAAILFESGSHKLVDKTVLVTAPESLRIQRVIKRDGATEAEVQARLKNQWPEEKKEKLADFVIRNNEQNLLIPQVQAFFETSKEWIFNKT